MALKVGVTRFLGTNCDADVRKWIESKGHHTGYLWYEDQFSINEYDAVVIPGGFSYGDYLRCGALAARTPVMKSVKEFASKGKPILGICNGFQILCESGLLPGVLLRNEKNKFRDEWVNLVVKQNKTAFLKDMNSESVLKLPIAHGDGRYYAESSDINMMLDNDLIWLTYEKNPNGSILDIAGITNKNKNICGLMPHPERAMATWMGSSDGAYFL